MKKQFAFLSLLFILSGCQNKPTQIMEESANAFAPNTVPADTRSAFLFASYHIEGSVNLNSTDYLILKDPRRKTYVFDPDLTQTIERLARRGISPQKKVVLLSETPNSLENKKWRWLLKNLEVDDVTTLSLDEFKKTYKNRRFAEPAAEPVWDLKISLDLQKEFIFKRSKDCFVGWSEKLCR